MKNLSFHKPKKLLLTALLAIIIMIFVFLVLKSLLKSEEQKQDYQQIASAEYDSVFLSMYPIDTYQEEDYAYFRGMTLFKSSYCIPSLSVLEDYMRRIADSGNQVSTAYLGIQPELTDMEKLQELLRRYPGITYEIILSYPSAGYWQALSQKDYEHTLTAYCDFLTAAPDIPEASFYFFGAQEWLIANPKNYQDSLAASEDAARVLMTHSDQDHGFLVTAENAAASAETLTALTRTLRTFPQVYPDLSDHCIIFFGDSVIGNYTDSTSIPEVVSGLTGAEIYNCGYGGNSAAASPDALITLPGITEAFFRGDLSVLPEGTQVYAGMASYLENAPGCEQICFVINYGLNDYFTGYAVSSEDPYDISTYSGAVRTAVKVIQENAPGAQIILCTPTFSAAFENGTEPHGPDNAVLTDYVDAILSLSQELQVDVSDNYHDLGITPENHAEYLADQVHPNNACRYLIGSNLSHILH